MKNFKVISSNPSNEGKSFVTKLFRETVVPVGDLGEKTKRETYYISSTKQIKVDSEVALDPKQWKITERPFELNGEDIMCKWLHLGDVKPDIKVYAPVEKETV